MGNYTPTKEITDILKKYLDCEFEEVRDTCILAVDKHTYFYEKKE